MYKGKEREKENGKMERRIIKYVSHTVYNLVVVSELLPCYRLSTQYYRKREGKRSLTHLPLCVTYRCLLSQVSPGLILSSWIIARSLKHVGLMTSQALHLKISDKRAIVGFLKQIIFEKLYMLIERERKSF